MVLLYRFFSRLHSAHSVAIFQPCLRARFPSRFHHVSALFAEQRRASKQISSFFPVASRSPSDELLCRGMREGKGKKIQNSEILLLWRNNNTMERREIVATMENVFPPEKKNGKYLWLHNGSRHFASLRKANVNFRGMEKFDFPSANFLDILESFHFARDLHGENLLLLFWHFLLSQNAKRKCKQSFTDFGPKARAQRVAVNLFTFRSSAGVSSNLFTTALWVWKWDCA